MTPAEIETVFAALPPEERGELLNRLCGLHDGGSYGPPELTPEQIALVRERIEMTERGEGKLLTPEEVSRGLRERIERHRRLQQGAEAEGELADAA